MNNSLKDALSKANYSKFVWKGQKVKEGNSFKQESIRLIDATPEQLRYFYAHCKKMLENKDPKKLGRYNVLELVKDQIERCNIELLIRYFENVYLSTTRSVIKRHNLALNLRALKYNNPEVEDWSTVKMNRISAVASVVPEGIPDEFSDISIDALMEGCTDSLGAFDKSHLTMSFIVKMGLWLTKAEELEFKSNSNAEKLNTAKTLLRLPEKFNLRFNDKGLSFHEMRAIITLPSKQRYSDMTTEQLLALRNKVLIRYMKEVDNHIYSWNKLMKEIKLVANYRNIEL